MDPFLLSQLCRFVRRTLTEQQGPIKIKWLLDAYPGHLTFDMLQFMHFKEFIIYHRNHAIERGKHFDALDFVIRMLMERDQNGQTRHTGG